MPAASPRLIAGALSSPLFTSAAPKDVAAKSKLVIVSVLARSSRVVELDTSGVASDSASDTTTLGACEIICWVVLDPGLRTSEAVSAGLLAVPTPSEAEGSVGCDSGGADAAGVLTPGADWSGPGNVVASPVPVPGLDGSSSSSESYSSSESDTESSSPESRSSSDSNPESSSPPSSVSSPDSSSDSSSSFSSVN